MLGRALLDEQHEDVGQRQANAFDRPPEEIQHDVHEGVIAPVIGDAPPMNARIDGEPRDLVSPLKRVHDDKYQDGVGDILREHAVCGWFESSEARSSTLVPKNVWVSRRSTRRSLRSPRTLYVRLE